ncbi:hypothetical protein ACSU1N_06800 [Thermogladius sp. 4427co]|uniref:hypothetical protein n=1 Tax=Thermogladius sp. 4427co TaxID=3450718 RepID=UPI003F79BED1
MGFYGRKLRAVIIFGSSVYNPLRSRDVDIIVVVDRIEDVKEKYVLELEISKELRKCISKPVDVIVFDVEMLEENTRPGTVLSGLIAGYVVVYDEIGVESILEKVLENILQVDEYIIVKKGRKLDLASIAKARKILRKNS